MSMEHKAFLFDSGKFKLEIERVISSCYDSQGKEYAIEYIKHHHEKLKSPYTGDLLDSNWMNEVENDDIQEYIDFILTACYNPTEDIGLEYSWESLIEVMKSMNLVNNPEQLVLGMPIKCNGIIVDPGRMGLGIIDANQISDMKEELINSRDKLGEAEFKIQSIYHLSKDEIIDSYSELCAIYKLAEEKRLGLLMTF